MTANSMLSEPSGGALTQGLTHTAEGPPPAGPWPGVVPVMGEEVRDGQGRVLVQRALCRPQPFMSARGAFLDQSQAHTHALRGLLLHADESSSHAF